MMAENIKTTPDKLAQVCGCVSSLQCLSGILHAQRGELDAPENSETVSRNLGTVVDGKMVCIPSVAKELRASKVRK